jgi:hypothetical protein
MGTSLPIHKRPIDILILVFILGALGVALTFSTEQLTIPNYAEFKSTKSYPSWPPKQYVELVHWWGENYDPMILLRPTWYRIAMWYNVVLFVPYYLFAFYAFLFGREWIRTPTMMYASSICILMSMLITEALFNKELASTVFNVTIPVYATFFFIPLLMWIRVYPSTVFSTEEKSTSKLVKIPFSKRPMDWIIVGFFIAALVIVYTIDAEQLIIPDYNEYKSKPYTLAWPPKVVLEAVHWWGETFDPILLVRPYWYKAAVWIDVIYFGPYYLFAIYAYIVGAEWIKVWSILYGGIICANLSVIFFEHVFGPIHQPEMLILFLVYASYLFIPLIVLAQACKTNMFHEVVKEKTK